MASKNRAYVDTSAFISFLDDSDSYHILFASLFADPPSELVTTPLVINEGHAWFLRRYDNLRGIDFINFIECLDPVKIIDIGSKNLTEASKLIKKFKDQKITITDAVGLALMKEFKITTCWSTDRHLGLLGSSLVIYK